MDLISRLLLERKINFEPLSPDPFTLDNCAICGTPIEDKDAKKGIFICKRCHKVMDETPGYFAASSD